MRVSNLSAPIHLMLLGAIFLVVVCATATAFPTVHYIKKGFADESPEDAEAKLALINKLLGAMAQMVPEDQGPYLDSVKDLEVKRVLQSKKAQNRICHFKVCNMGKRRRR